MYMDFIKEISFKDFKLSDFKRAFTSAKIVYIKDVPDINADEFYTEISAELGLLLKKDVDPVNKTIIDDAWTTIKYDKRYIHQTYKHSNKHQPLHTDYCNASINIDGVVLFCEIPATYGGATCFIDGVEVISLLQQYEPELLKKLENTEMIFGKKPSPIFRNCTKVVAYDKLGPILNWNYAVVAEDNSKEALDLAENFHYFLEEYVFNAGLPIDIPLKRNEAVLFHDKRILHGRRSFLGDRFLLKGGVFTRSEPGEREHIKKLL